MSDKPRILVAMSGGVDSSVAALLLKEQGYDIAGAYMKNWVNEDNPIGECPWQQDIDDAQATCEHIGIPFQVVNLMKDYRHRVVDYLLKGYQEGFTPNPDIMCNREIKFGVFRQWAFEHGFNAVATGHYAQLRKLSDGNTGLYEGADSNKDQSYFLALLKQEQIAGAYFPIGHLEKPRLREIAERAGLPNARKKDSQGICFIGQVKMKDFLRQYVPDSPGPIVRASDNRFLGMHKGLHYFTLGQRKGIGIPSNTDNENYVVVGKRSTDKALLVSFASSQDPTLHVSEVRVHSLQWNCPPLSEAQPLEGRVRYRDPRVKLDFIPDVPAKGESYPTSALIRFHIPQRSLASGQILALYDNNRLLGGGIYI